jgi:hypothetical protein
MTITGTLTTYDISVIMTPIGNMGYEVKLQYGHVSGVLYDVNTVLMEYIGRWHMSSATVTKWSGWFQRVLSNNNELELSKRRIVYGNVSNACWLPLGTMTVPTGINSQRQVAIQFYGGRAASFNTHYAGTFALSINTGETTTNVQGRLHYDQVTQPTISLRPRFGYSGTPNVKGSVMTIWLYADGGWPFLYYNNITTTDSSMGVVLRANGTITDGIVTTAPSGWTEITAS